MHEPTIVWRKGTKRWVGWCNCGTFAVGGEAEHEHLVRSNMDLHLTASSTDSST